MPNRLISNEEVAAMFEAHGLEPPRVAVPDHARAACDHCWHRTPVPGQVCCWCGTWAELLHGPYVPGGAYG